LVVGFTVGVYVVRYLGPTSYGELAYAVSFVGLFIAIATMGLPGIVVRELVKNASAHGKLLGSSFVLYLGGSVFTILLIALAAPMAGATRFEKWLILIIASATVIDSFKVIDLHYQSIAQSRYVVQVQVVQLAVSSVIKIALILVEAGLIWFAVVSVVDSTVLAIGLVINYKRTCRWLPTQWRFSPETARDLLRESWPLLLSGVVVAIYMRIDQVMIRVMLDASAVGSYAAAVRISEAWYFVPMLITQSFFPAIVAAQREDQELMERRFQSIYNLLIWMAIAVAVASMVFGEWAILFLYGRAFADSATVLSIHIWAGVFVSAAVLRGRWFVVMNLQRLAFLTVLVGATLNVIGNLVLIPTLGMNGAAWSTLLARVLSFYVIAAVFPEVRVTILSFHRALLAPLTKLVSRIS
jgi:O-antigen/teichoic acid export membrane protein